MILISLRDTHPGMFGPRTKHQKRMAKAQALAFKRRANFDKKTGTGKVRIAASRLQHYLRALAMLVNRPQILAELAARDEAAWAGGVEAPR
jgi:hypothetical protein